MDGKPMLTLERIESETALELPDRWLMSATASANGLVAAAVAVDVHNVNVLSNNTVDVHNVLNNNQLCVNVGVGNNAPVGCQ